MNHVAALTPPALCPSLPAHRYHTVIIDLSIHFPLSFCALLQCFQPVTMRS